MLVVCCKVLPHYSPTSAILNNLVMELDPDEYQVVSQDFGPQHAVKVGEDVPCPQPVYLNEAREPNRVTRRLNVFLRIARIPALARRIEAAGRRYGCRQVLAVYPDITFVAAAALAAKRLKVPFYPWLHNTIHAMQGASFYNRYFQLERRILSTARCIFTMSDSMRDFYRKAYPAKQVETLPHPFKLPSPFPPPPPPSQKPLRLLFTGNINESNRDALTRMLDAFGNQPDNFDIHISSKLPVSVFQEKYGTYSNLTYHGFIDDRALRELEASADVLLLPHGLDGTLPPVEYQTIFPTKTVSYLMTNRPILAHVTPESNIDHYLRSHRLAIIENSRNPAAIRDALLQALQAPEGIATLLTNAREALHYFDAREVADNFRTQILATESTS
jgi:hypothetical protein